MFVMPNFKLIVHEEESPTSPKSVVACTSNTKTARTGRRTASSFKELQSDDTSIGLVIQESCYSDSEAGRCKSEMSANPSCQEQTDFPSISYVSTAHSYITDEEWVTKIEYYPREGSHDNCSKPSITTVIPYIRDNDLCLSIKNDDPVEKDPDILAAHLYFDNKFHKKLSLSSIAAMSMVARSMGNTDANKETSEEKMDVEGYKVDDSIETDPEILVAHMYFDKKHGHFQSTGSATMSTLASSDRSSVIEVGTLINRISEVFFWGCSCADAFDHEDRKMRRRQNDDEPTIGSSFSSEDDTFNENCMSMYASTYTSTIGDGATTTIATRTSRYDDDTLTYDDSLTYNDTSTYNDTITYNETSTYIDTITYNETLTQTLEDSTARKDFDASTLGDEETSHTYHDGTLSEGDGSSFGDEDHRDDKAESVRNEDSSYGSGSFRSPLSDSYRSTGKNQRLPAESTSRSLRHNSNFRISLLPPDIGNETNNKIEATDSLSYTKSRRFNTDLINSFIELKSTSVSSHNCQQQATPTASPDEIFTVGDAEALERYETEQREELEPDQPTPEPIWRNFDAPASSSASPTGNRNIIIHETLKTDQPEEPTEPVSRYVPAPSLSNRPHESLDLLTTDFSSKNVKITVVNIQRCSVNDGDDEGTDTNATVKAVQPKRHHPPIHSKATQPSPSSTTNGNSSHSRSGQSRSGQSPSDRSQSDPPSQLRIYGRDEDGGNDDGDDQRLLEDVRDGPDGDAMAPTTTAASTVEIVVVPTKLPFYRPAGRRIQGDSNDSPTMASKKIPKKKRYPPSIDTSPNKTIIDGSGLKPPTSPKVPENLTPMARLRNPISYDILTCDK